MIMTARNSITLALVVLVGAIAGCASTQATTDNKAQASVPKPGKTVRAMYAFADQNKDGQLTREEAKGHLPITYDNFDSIDTAKRGWISFEQFLAFTNKRVGKQADDILKIGEPM